MAGRTFISQPSQIFGTEEFDDTLDFGVGLETGSVNLQFDMNALRSQVKRILWTGLSGSWYDDVTPTTGPQRGLNLISSDLADLESKRIIFRAQKIVSGVVVPAGQNYVALSVSGSTAPNNFASVGETNQTGSIVAELTSGSFDSHSLLVVTGTTDISPKNLVLIRDAGDGSVVQDAVSGSRDVYGLLQVEFGTPDGGDFDDVDQRVQISFVVEESGSLVPASVDAVAGGMFNYSYPIRTTLETLPDDALLSNHIFLDVPAESIQISGNALLSDITLDRALDNQGATPATQATDINIEIASGSSWRYYDEAGTGLYSEITSDFSGQGSAARFTTDNFIYSGVNAAQFHQGLQVYDDQFPNKIIYVNTEPGEIGSSEELGIVSGDGFDLTLSGGLNLRFHDSGSLESVYNGNGILFSSGTTQWDNFATRFGVDETILGAFITLSSSIDSLSSSLDGITTLQEAIDAQGTTPVFLSSSIFVNVNDQIWQFTDNGNNVLTVSTASFEVNVDNISLQSSGNIEFVDSGSLESFFSGSSILFSSGTTEWNTFHSLFGPEVTILNALNSISASLSGSNSARTRTNAGTTPATLAPGTNVAFPTNIDTQMPDLTGCDFINDLNIYLNGVLLFPALGAGQGGDVYPGDSLTNGDLKFEERLRSGSIITIEKFGAIS